MTPLESIGLVNQVLFIGLLVAVVVAALRQPSRTRRSAEAPTPALRIDSAHADA